MKCWHSTHGSESIGSQLHCKVLPMQTAAKFPRLKRLQKKLCHQAYFPEQGFKGKPSNQPLAASWPFGDVPKIHC
eukprot:1594490-Amphidinium_carterae.1